MDEIAVIRISKIKNGKNYAIKFLFKKNGIIGGFIKPIRTCKLWLHDPFDKDPT